MRRQLVLGSLVLLTSALSGPHSSAGETEPTEPASCACAPAPADAIVLFDGSNLDEFHVGGQRPNWTVANGVVTVGSGDLTTKRELGDIQLHVEWRTPTLPPDAKPQGPTGNSGIKLHEAYEIQILDPQAPDYDSKGLAGALYGQCAPLVNVTRPPGEWQSFDIVFRAPRFNAEGTLVQHGRITALQNGTLIHDNTQIQGRTNSSVPARTPYRQPFHLQGHGSRVQFRNIWVRELARRPEGVD